MPGRGSRSRTQTLRPRRASDHAAASPTTPAPITAVSLCSISELRLLIVPLDRVLVTGANGQLAAFIVQAFADREVIALTRQALDVTDPALVARTVADIAPDLIVNCAAFNDVDGAEHRAIEAIAINALAVRSLKRAADAVGATLVHYSTDFVLNSDGPEPHKENVRPAPRGVYASSKLLGEWMALESPADANGIGTSTLREPQGRPEQGRGTAGSGPSRAESRDGESRSRAFVLRVVSLFGSPAGWSGRRGTLDHIVDGLEQGRDVKVFTDRIVSPSYSKDVAAATRHLVLSGASSGVYHCVNNGHASWHDVAVEAARILGVAPHLVPITVAQLPLRVPRPVFCALSTKK